MASFLKRIVCLSLACTLALGVEVYADAEEANINVIYNGVRVDFPSPPALMNNVVMVPMRKIFETMGSSVYWGGKNKTITSVKGDNLIVLRIGSTLATSFGNAYRLDVAPYLNNGSTYVPLRFVSESLGLKVSWDPATSTVDLRPGDAPDRMHKMPYTNYEDQDTASDVSGVSLYDLEDNSPTKVVALSNLITAQLSEERPYQSIVNSQTLELNAAQGKQSKVLLRFDLGQLKGKHIKAAYLRLTNQKNQEVNAVRTLAVQEATKPWDFNANWSNASRDASGVTASQTIFRLLGWEPAWFIDVTDTVKAWNSYGGNYGFMLSVDRNLSLFNLPKTGLKPFLMVEYADKANAPALTYKAKLKQALEFLGYQNSKGSWSDLQVGTLNAQANADRLRLGQQYLDSLIQYFDDYITVDGKLLREAAVTNSYYYGSLGKVLIHMYQRLGKQKYRVALEQIRRSYDNLRQVDGIYLDNETYQGELAYLGLDFLAAYGEAFNDPASTDIAIRQINRLYDVLTSQDTNGVPFTLLPKTETYTGTFKGLGWGRGIGWLYAGMGKLLTYRSFKQHPAFSEFAWRFKHLSRTLADLQDASGMWHSSVQNKELPLETSGTSMIALGMEYGYREGVLDPSFKTNVDRAVNGLQRYTRTGVEMGNSFPNNQDLMYTYPYLSTTRYSYGFWMELLTTRELYRKAKGE